MRIVSLLPSATELVYALGLGDRLVGRSHECDYPPEVARLPALTGSLVPGGHCGAELDALVSRAAHEHRSLYRLDCAALQRLQPDLILTQELCEVCAVAYDEVEKAARSLRASPGGASAARIVSLEPMSLDDVLAQLHVVARAVVEAGGGEPVGALKARAAEVERALRERLDAVRRRAADLPAPRVLCLEWLDPPWCAGHWVPEMVRMAGGADELGVPAGPSRRMAWSEVLEYRPDVVVLMPCGYDLAGTLAEYDRVRQGGAPGERGGALPDGWQDLPAVRAGRVYAVNASAYFNRPGPRVVDGVEILAQILHPDIFGNSRMGRDWAPAP